MNYLLPRKSIEPCLIAILTLENWFCTKFTHLEVEYYNQKIQHCNSVRGRCFKLNGLIAYVANAIKGKVAPGIIEANLLAYLLFNLVNSAGSYLCLHNSLSTLIGKLPYKPKK